MLLVVMVVVSAPCSGMMCPCDRGDLGVGGVGEERGAMGMREEGVREG